MQPPFDREELSEAFMRIKTGRPVLALFLFLAALWPVSRAAGMEIPGRLAEMIAAENTAAIRASLEDGTYRGEAGILRLRPEAGKDLGLRVQSTSEYEEGLALHRAAGLSLERAKRAMTARRPETFPGGPARAIIRNVLEYKELKDRAETRLLDYRASLSPEVDERLDPTKCGALMRELLGAALERAGGRLRDALGCLYNTCMDVDSDACLTPENVRFVNAVFAGFTEEASPEELAGFDLDRLPPPGERPGPDRWRRVALAEAPALVPALEEALERIGPGNPAPVDPLLFLALMKRESSFNPDAVSHVGAAGLTQIMPATAKALGMKEIFHPDYFDRAFSVMGKEREARRKAMAALLAIDAEDDLKEAAGARELMQESLELKKERIRLFSRYRRELAQYTSDSRFLPEEAVFRGLSYFADLLEKQGGDISLALASYNAGPHRVKEYGGIPPFTETVRFRNRVLEFYRDYLERVRVE